MAVTRSSSKLQPHVLTLGCTGMLAGTALELETDGYAVSYLSRSGKLPSGSSGTSHICDWQSETSLKRAVRDAIDAHGVPEVILAWAHSVGPVLELARQVSNPSQTIRLHHVLGSSVSDPSRKDTLSRIRLGFEQLPGIEWRAICLGFVREEGRSRWLSHDEISAGALSAIRLKTPFYTIGQTAPWKLRP